MRPNRRSTEYVVWHCSATPPSQDIGSAQIDIMHKAKGWDGIGYAMVVRRDGRLETGEDLKKRGAHVKGLNSVSVGICMIGGVDEDGNAENNFTAEQWQAAKHAFEFLTLLYPDAKHVGHRDLSPDLNADGRVQRHEFIKDCPCFSVKEWIGNSLGPVSELYAKWELAVSVAVPEEKITIEEVLVAASDDDYVPDKSETRSNKKRKKRRG
jgi:N-acetylmuramoyl-L-alanine amidase